VIIKRCEVDDADVEQVVQNVGDVELLPEFPGIQRLHEITEDSGIEGVVNPPQAPAPQTNAELQPPPAEVNQPAVVLPPAVPSVCQPVAQAEANAAAAMGLDPTRVTLSQLGGKRKKVDKDPQLESYKLKMLKSTAEREEERWKNGCFIRLRWRFDPSKQNLQDDDGTAGEQQKGLLVSSFLMVIIISYNTIIYYYLAHILLHNFIW
jgi:hypothetical protein